MIERIRKTARESIETKQSFFDANSELVASAADLIIDSIKSGGKILVFGNGGAAADAQHIAPGVVNKITFPPPPLPPNAPPTHTSLFTSAPNESPLHHPF